MHGSSPPLFSTASLQILCLSQLICSLEHYPPELLSYIPTTLQYKLLLHSPVIDICRLIGKTCAFDGIDSEKLWGECYLKHLEKDRPNYY